MQPVNTWRPTERGWYRLEGQDACIVYPGVLVFSEALRFRPDGTEGEDPPIPNGRWSLVGPDWQSGPPTVEQLKRWQWWALLETDTITAGTTLPDESFEGVTHSAPIQFDMSNGLLWVPLEVSK